jgi:2,3,4,5-tetrahydropyridine-2-carboxylate N-succinyltransferase
MQGDDLKLQALIEAGYRDRASLGLPSFDPVFRAELKAAVEAVIDDLDQGRRRVAIKRDGVWHTDVFCKQAILLYFALRPMEMMELSGNQGGLAFHDKIPVKRDLARAGIRVVPPGVARYGSHLQAGTILMPAYVNIGAYVGAGTMIDTWATVGSCAQIGRNVHLSGGVGIGGVLEPPQANPVIVEDGAFIGSRCIIVEGVVVETEAVLGANVVLTASTPILDVSGTTPVLQKGRVPARSVVIPGTLPKQFPAGTYQVPCALIIGQRKASTDQKTSLNEALRSFEVPV